MLSVTLIEASPDEDVGIHEAGAYAGVGLVGMECPMAVFQFHAVQLATTLGDDIDHGRQGHIAIERGGRAAQHLNMVYLVGADVIVHRVAVVHAVVQAVSVLHDQNEFLCSAVGTVHRHVECPVTIDLVHARHVCGQYLPEAFVVAEVLNHLCCDDGDGGRGLLSGLLEAGGSGDREVRSAFHLINDVNKGFRVTG